MQLCDPFLSSSYCLTVTICESLRCPLVKPNCTSLCDSSLLTGAPEVGALLLYCWSCTRQYPSEASIEDLATHLSNETTAELWHDGLTLLMSDAADAEEVIEMCIWSMHRRITDMPLSHLLFIIRFFIKDCPDGTAGALEEHWVRLLLSLARAWERQLCSGNEMISHEYIMPRGLRIVKYV